MNRAIVLCCTALLRVQYSTQLSSSYTRSLYLIALDDTLSYVHHMFTDGTGLYNSAPRSSTDSLFCNMQKCVSDVKKWTVHIKLQLNEDKTDALLFNQSRSSDLPDVL